VNLALVPASSRSGRVVEADVLAFLESQANATPPTGLPAGARAGVQPVELAAPDRDVIVPVTGVRQVIFNRMGESSRAVAHVTLTTEADATRLVELRDELNAAQTEMKLGFTAMLALLVSRALMKYPYMNATLREDGVHQHAFVNLGVAADTERGLLVPVIRDAHRKGLQELSADLARLGEQARTGKITPDELRGGTFTITNLGQYEIDAFTPLVNQPETAILGLGRIAQKPAAHAGQLALRWMVTLSLSFDHRLVDGAPAARFIQQVKKYIELPGLVLV
jgi:pyruvate dehydrogenase E2 component (dihydrolipoamide acetyltransferase)